MGEVLLARPALYHGTLPTKIAMKIGLIVECAPKGLEDRI